jgi:hypothetical protein
VCCEYTTKQKQQHTGTALHLFNGISSSNKSSPYSSAALPSEPFALKTQLLSADICSGTHSTPADGYYCWHERTHLYTNAAAAALHRLAAPHMYYICVRRERQPLVTSVQYTSTAGCEHFLYTHRERERDGINKLNKLKTHFTGQLYHYL